MQRKRFALLFDLRRCNGCYACQVACKAENNVPLGVFRIRVNTYEYGQYPNTKRIFLPTVCAQSGADTAILKACNNGSVTLDENGVVVKNIGAPSYNIGEIEKMVNADPYGGAYLQPYDGQIDFCDFCMPVKENAAGAPACARTCNTEAIYFGDLNDSDSDISRYIKKWNGKIWKGEAIKVKRLKEKENPNVNVLYIGLLPEMEDVIEGYKQFDPSFMEISRWEEKSR